MIKKKQYFKYLLIAVLLLLTSLSYASIKAKPYIGVAGDFEYFKARQEFQFDANKVSSVDNYNLNYTLHNLTPNFTLKAGYHFSIFNYLLAGELTSTIFQQTTSFTNDDVDSHVTQKYAFTLQGKFGYTFKKENTLYLLAGYALARVNNSIDFPGGGRYNSGTMLLSDIGEQKTLSGPLLGIGYSYKLNKNVSLDVNYQHIFYSDAKMDIDHRTITFNNPKGTDTLKVTSDLIQFGINYYF